MNQIAIEQNSPLNISRLQAQRRLYSRAKRILFWQLVAGGPIAVAFAFLTASLPPIKAYAALWGILVAIADIAWLTARQKRLRTLAAQIQEQFDCDVLALPWNEVKAGKPPIAETVEEAAQYYRDTKSSMADVKDWYSPQVSEVPIHVARIICQRQNCWWDSNQRRRYATVVVALVALVFIGVLVVSIPHGLKLEQFLVAVLLPLLPALLIGYRQFTEQMEAAVRLDALREHAERLWTDVLSGLSPRMATSRARALQDEIFENRKRSPLVFDRIFNWFRDKHQALATHSAAHYVSEARRKLMQRAE
jgi:hypothetical protein